jgi:hypothetical protein
VVRLTDRGEMRRVGVPNNLAADDRLIENIFEMCWRAVGQDLFETDDIGYTHVAQATD